VDFSSLSFVFSPKTNTWLNRFQLTFQVVKGQGAKMRLQNFNAWGLVETTKTNITVSLSALTSEEKQIKRTIKATAERKVPQGKTAVALAIAKKGYTIKSYELHAGDSVADHPEVLKVVDEVVEWIRISIGN
jgi:hypothetical protein